MRYLCGHYKAPGFWRFLPLYVGPVHGGNIWDLSAWCGIAVGAFGHTVYFAAIRWDAK